jgi:hypothetical protein
MIVHNGPPYTFGRTFGNICIGDRKTLYFVKKINENTNAKTNKSG